MTRTASDTYTEARARYVMGKVYDHLVSLFVRGILTKDRADRMRSDILYLMDRKAVSFFELQFHSDAGTELGGLHYEVHDNATVSIDEPSGGLNFWGLPATTTVNLVVLLKRTSPHIAEVDRQLEVWGWGNTTALSGTSQASKSFSKDGYGLKESIVGQW